MLSVGIETQMPQALMDALRTGDAVTISSLRGKLELITDPEQRKEAVLTAARQFPIAVAKGFREAAGEFNQLLADHATAHEQASVLQTATGMLSIGFGAALRYGRGDDIATLRALESELSITVQPERLRERATGLSIAVRDGYVDAIGKFVPVFERAGTQSWYAEAVAEVYRQLAQTPPEKLGATIRELAPLASGLKGHQLEVTMMAIVDALRPAGKAGAGDAMKALGEMLDQHAHELNPRSRARLLARLDKRIVVHGKYHPATLWKKLESTSADKELAEVHKQVRKLLTDVSAATPA
jgi:hypothetical protein